MLQKKNKKKQNKRKTGEYEKGKKKEFAHVSATMTHELRAEGGRADSQVLCDWMAEIITAIMTIMTFWAAEIHLPAVVPECRHKRTKE